MPHIRYGNAWSTILEGPEVVAEVKRALTFPLPKRNWALASHVRRDHIDKPAVEIAGANAQRLWRQAMAIEPQEHVTDEVLEANRLLDSVIAIRGAAEQKKPFDRLRSLPEEGDFGGDWTALCEMYEVIKQPLQQLTYADDFEAAQEPFRQAFPKCGKCRWEWAVSFVKYKRVPTGLLSLIEDVTIEDKPDPPVGQPIPSSIALRDYQLDLLYRAFVSKRGIIEAATGSGKTELCLALATRLGLNTLILVPTTPIFNEFRTRWERYVDAPLGTVAQGQADIQQVTLAIFHTSWTKSAVGKELQGVDCLIVDEHHKAAARSYFDWCMSCDAYYRFGQTATAFRDNEIDDLRLQATTGPVIARVTTAELQEAEHLSEAEVIFHEVACPTVGKTWPTQYRSGIVHNAQRNEMIVRLVLEELCEGNKVLILVAWDEHAQLLMDALPQCVYFTGGKSAKQHEEWKREFEERCDLAIGTTVVDLGFDVPAIDVLIQAAGGESDGREQQRIGRALRRAPDGHKKRIHEFMDVDRKGILREHSESRMARCKAIGLEVRVEE